MDLEFNDTKTDQGLMSARHDQLAEVPASDQSGDTIANNPSQPEKITKNPTESNTRQNLTLIFIALTQLVQMMPLGVGINSGLVIGTALGASHIQSAWVMASYPLTQGTFVLIGGRMGAIYGHKKMLTIGSLIWIFWVLASGYATNLVAFCIMRAFSGLGAGLLMPNIIALIGIKFPPGRKRNLAFAFFGAMAPVGAAGGSLVGAIVIQLADWKWCFLLLSLLGVVVYGGAILLIEPDQPLDPHGSLDILGAYLGVAGLVLFNFVWNQAPLVGWSNPYEIALLIIAVIHLMGFVVWGKYAKDPIMPFDIWMSPSFGKLVIVLFFAFMSLGVYFWYMNVYMQTITGTSLIKTGVQFLPLTIVGAATPFLAGWLIPRLPAQVIIGMGCLAMVIINVLLATIPADITYWAMAFPAMFISAFTIDLIITSAQIIASNTVQMKHQGTAGSLVGTLLGWGLSTGVGFAGTVEMHTNDDGRDLLKGYHSAAFLAVGLSTAALALTFFIRIPKDTREGWAENDIESAANI